MLHGYRCQVCGETVTTAAGLYAEAAHVRPLGAPHDGPDTASNVLCLCPNDHVRFDGGALTIADDLTIVNASKTAIGKLRTLPSHTLDAARPCVSPRTSRGHLGPRPARPSWRSSAPSRYLYTSRTTGLLDP